MKKLLCKYKIYNFIEGEEYILRKVHRDGSITVFSNKNKTKWSYFTNYEQLNEFFIDARLQKLKKLNELH